MKIARRFPEILAIYNAGTIKHPGISDLDFVLVLKDELHAPFEIEGQLSDRLREVISGGSILKVPEHLAADIRLIDDFPLYYLAGKQFRFRRYANSWFEICRVYDWLPERLSTLVKLSNESEMDVRRVLGVLKSLTISLEKVSGLLGKPVEEQFCRAVRDIREGWLAQPKMQELPQLLQEGTQAACGALMSMDEWVQNNRFLGQVAGQLGVFAIADGPRFAFGERAAVVDRQAIVPVTVATFLAAQAACGGFMGGQIGRSFQVKPEGTLQLVPQLQATIEKRMDYLETLTAYFREYQLRRGLLKYGWFLQAEHAYA